ncbi:MAG: hypothetical protein ABFC38_05205 [Methanospirillum sp.]
MIALRGHRLNDASARQATGGTECLACVKDEGIEAFMKIVRSSISNETGEAVLAHCLASSACDA